MSTPSPTPTPCFRITLYIRDYTCHQPALGVTAYFPTYSVLCVHVEFPTCTHYLDFFLHFVCSWIYYDLGKCVLRTGRKKCAALLPVENTANRTVRLPGSVVVQLLLSVAISTVCTRMCPSSAELFSPLTRTHSLRDCPQVLGLTSK